MAIVYKITNRLTGAVYIGNTTVSLDTRWKQHIGEARRERCAGRKFYKAINKYGPENFETEVIEICPADISMERERFWISSYNSMESGYNETYGGKGKNFVDYKSVCEVFNMTRSVKETASILGIDSNTVRSALKQFGINTPDRYEAQVVTAKPVTAYTKDGKLVESFISVHDAVRWVNDTSGRQDHRSESTMRSHIVDVCNGNRKSAYGYIWSF